MSLSDASIELERLKELVTRREEPRYSETSGVVKLVREEQNVQSHVKRNKISNVISQREFKKTFLDYESHLLETR